jgi:hypothetical protein
MPWNPFSSTRSISISYRQEAVSEHRGPLNRSVVGKLVRDRFASIGEIARLAQRAFGFAQRDHRAADARLTMPGSAVFSVAVILMDPQGYEGAGEAQHENAGSRYGDQVN